MTKKTDPKIELWALDDIKPYPKNAKIHTPEQVASLATLIKEHGWTQPITVQKSSGLIIGGHGRRLAAISLGLVRVPVIVMDVDDEEARLMRISDNRVSSTKYDVGVMQAEIIELADLGADLSLTMMDAKELAFLEVDLGGMDEFDEASFVDDIGEAVERQREETAKHQDKIDATEQPVAKAFGISKVSFIHSRRIAAFMRRLETETGKAGVNALMAHFDSLGIGA